MGKRRAINPPGPSGPGAGKGQHPTGKPSGPGAGSGKLRGPEKKRTNSKPKDLDTQEIPFKLREIMRSRMEMKNPSKMKKKKKRAKKQGPKNEELQTDIKVPKFKQKKHESVYAYLDRMNRETKHVLFLSKNQPDRMPEKEVDEQGEPLKDVPQKEKSQKKKDFDRRRLDKFIKKKEDKKETRLEKDLFTDTVMFGEVVMAPPTLTVKPRKGKAESKPGEKQLLLKSLFDKSSSSAPPPAMSLARKRQLEDERERVVQAYRDLKKRKQLQSEAMIKPSKAQHT
ncbi:coiled-coil domain-containing protein 137 [Bufo gargarizans]|uniref:coiled-coil domain-containing protein 137 n=1 Tax=Bufo gargarizans TaxID=30331 RepID=UPI001CF426E3|nr:coiled-coil domain-containing protein 137 [Bufo gargarizans]